MQDPDLIGTYQELGAKKLTGRQMQYLRQVIILQQKNFGSPIHYSELAEMLGVSGVSAYNMLRVLEEKGCVTSSYSLPPVRLGRSTILFSVTALGRWQAG